MPDLFDLPPASPSDNPDGVALAEFAERAYLEYALSVVKGRALPDVCDGQKPVQRRILYAMQRMGLGHGASGAPKPVKSARVVGDVLGRYHPHGDTAAYDALVRMAQDFSLRYPLIDGQGNFGSRDGDGAAAMRYTEARLTPIARLLLDEIDLGTIDFIPNYDGSGRRAFAPAGAPADGAAQRGLRHRGRARHRDPAAQPARSREGCGRPREESEADARRDAGMLPAPDLPGGGQIISSPTDLSEAYRTGRGSIKVRARYRIEELARGQWQLVIDELPPGTSRPRRSWRRSRN
jgi:topoisomerase IV subunit A